MAAPASLNTSTCRRCCQDRNQPRAGTFTRVDVRLVYKSTRFDQVWTPFGSAFPRSWPFPLPMASMARATWTAVWWVADMTPNNPWRRRRQIALRYMIVACRLAGEDVLARRAGPQPLPALISLSRPWWLHRAPTFYAAPAGVDWV